jgi:hypothetical protein
MFRFIRLIAKKVEYADERLTLLKQRHAWQLSMDGCNVANMKTYKKYLLRDML